MSINPSLLIYVVDNFESGLKNFGIVNDDIFNELLFFLSNYGIKIENNKIDISIYNKLTIALIAIHNGVDVGNICRKINWHDFELFSSEIMKYHGYAVYTNFRLKNPRREIDVIGIKSQKALLIDCKHWQKNSISGLKQIVEKQKNRSILFVQKSKMNIENAFPIILTFLPNDFGYIDGVPIVSINKLNSFLLDFDGIYQNFYKI
ncbi:MAG: NERD domain-containing protein [Candidatus Nitrosocosmicus sp.]